ncbi:MAG: hypothetical protein H7176_12430 [Bdellovibrionales bacterium]|nr:hypothetical protein [Massilia sp.]
MDEKNIIGLDDPTDGKDSLAQRKTQLKRQADFYRVGIVHSKASIKQSARPEALFHRAIDHASWAIRSRIDSVLRPTGINVASVMPYAVSLLGLLRKRKLMKPALGVLAAAAGVAVYVWQRRTNTVH